MAIQPFDRLTALSVVDELDGCFVAALLAMHAEMKQNAPAGVYDGV